MSETSVADSETREYDFFAAKKSIWRRPRNWNLFYGTKIVRGFGIPEFVPGEVDKGTVIGFEIVSRKGERISYRRDEQ